MIELDNAATSRTDVQPERLADAGDQNALFAPRSLPRFFSYGQVAEIFGKSPRTIRDWVKKGHLEAIRVGRARPISEAEIRRLAGQPSLPNADNSSAPSDEGEG